MRGRIVLAEGLPIIRPSFPRHDIADQDLEMQNRARHFGVQLSEARDEGDETGWWCEEADEASN